MSSYPASGSGSQRLTSHRADAISKLSGHDFTDSASTEVDSLSRVPSEGQDSDIDHDDYDDFEAKDQDHIQHVDEYFDGRNLNDWNEEGFNQWCLTYNSPKFQPPGALRNFWINGLRNRSKKREGATEHTRKQALNLIRDTRIKKCLSVSNTKFEQIMKKPSKVVHVTAQNYVKGKTVAGIYHNSGDFSRREITPCDIKQREHDGAAETEEESTVRLAIDPEQVQCARISSIIAEKDANVFHDVKLPGGNVMMLNLSDQEVFKHVKCQETMQRMVGLLPPIPPASEAYLTAAKMFQDSRIVEPWRSLYLPVAELNHLKLLDPIDLNPPQATERSRYESANFFFRYIQRALESLHSAGVKLSMPSWSPLLTEGFFDANVWGPIIDFLFLSDRELTISRRGVPIFCEGHTEKYDGVIRFVDGCDVFDLGVLEVAPLFTFSKGDQRSTVNRHKIQRGMCAMLQQIMYRVPDPTILQVIGVLCSGWSITFFRTCWDGVVYVTKEVSFTVQTASDIWKQNLVIFETMVRYKEILRETVDAVQKGWMLPE